MLMKSKRFEVKANLNPCHPLLYLRISGFVEVFWIRGEKVVEWAGAPR